MSYFFANSLMQERTRIRQSIWHSTETLPNPKAMLPIMFCTAGVTSDIIGCCDAIGVEICSLSTFSNVLASEETFLEECNIIVSISLAESRFLFLIVSHGGVCFWGIIAETLAFNMFADALSDDFDDLLGIDKHESSESAVKDCPSSSIATDSESESI